MNDTDRRSDGLSMIDLIATLLRRKWIIIGVTGVVVVISFTFLMITSRLPLDSRWNRYPDYFLPTVKVLIQESSNISGISQMLQSSGLGNLASLAGMSSGSGRSNADLAQALLRTPGVLDPIVEEFKIVERFNITKTPRTKSRKAIADSLSIKYAAESGILTIGFQSTDREFATRVVTRIVEELSTQFKRLTLDQVMARQQLLVGMLAEQTVEADRASHALIDFQSTHGILDVTTQMTETARYLTQLNSQITSKQLELKVLMKYYPDKDPRIVQLQGEIEELQNLMGAVQEGSSEFNTGPVSQKQLPALQLEYVKVKRDAEIQQQLLGTIMQQLELNRLEEKNTAQLFQVLEAAEIPEIKAGPPRTMLLMISTFAAAVVSILLAFLVDFFKRAPTDPREAASMASLRDALSPRRKRRS